MPDVRKGDERTTIVSVCICTRDRPVELERVLSSIARGLCRPDSVLVSDDSEQPDVTREICSRFPFVTYLDGPRRGLCANRNAVISQAVSDYVTLGDDDCIFSETFFARLRERLPRLEPKEILTGDVFENGIRIVPNNPSFLGHFRKRPQGTFKNINLNANCFPRAALLEERFDESLVYGYEDMDLCARLLRSGYRILHAPELHTVHAPPQRLKRQDQLRYAQAEQARFKTSLKRYLLWESKPHLALLYVFVAPIHRVFHDLLRKKFEDLPRVPGDMLTASRDALRHFRELRSQRRSRPV